MPQTTARSANRLLWTAQVLLALLFLFAGTMKFVLPMEKMAGPMGLSGAFIHFIGTAEVLGALGLILPGAFRWRVAPLAERGAARALRAV